MMDRDHSARRVEERVREELVALANRTNVYVILDAARIRGLTTLLNHLDMDYECLLPTRLSHVAPHLVRFEPSETWFTWFELRPEHLNAAMFVVSHRPRSQVRRQLKRLLRVRGTDGQPRYFRLYDPRVLRTFWKACDSSERGVVLHGIESLRARDETDESVSSGPALRTWARDENAPMSVTMPLPTWRHPFALRNVHEESLREDAWRRYQARAAEYLLQAIDGVDERQVHAAIETARAREPHLNGYDLTLLAESIVQHDLAQTLAAAS